ncbi:hypothetical protein TDB9533_01907 [Thalassocella blandensis]|nr:hypothetical protein TDB9533_01907 [Thalassocella blandensis]
MNKRISKVVLLCVLGLVGVTSGISGCSSSGPATSFYSLFPSKTASEKQFALPSGSSGSTALSLGVGPVVLPDFIDKPAIVGLTHTAKVKVYGYHAWAGDLSETIARVVGENISNHLQLNSVWAFPWDNRVRPDYQLRIEFENLSGVRGENVDLLLKWTLLNKKADTVLVSGKERLSQATSGNNVDAYVTTMNGLVNAASSLMAEKIAAYLHAQP